jgi:hypothetical protein
MNCGVEQSFENYSSDEICVQNDRNIFAALL